MDSKTTDCRHIDEILIRSGQGQPGLDDAAREHLRSCERCRALAGLMQPAAPAQVDPALLERISGSVLPGLRPVRPLPRPWVFIAALLLIFAAVAVAGASHLGMYGIRKLSNVERASIFPVLGLLAWLAAAASVTEMVPGSRRRLSPVALLLSASLVLVAVFALLFHDYSMDRFVSQGVRCLEAGLLYAVPAALLTGLLLRRGFVLDSVAAGIAAGAFAGLAGVGMLELHCPNLAAMHVMVWHVAVLLVSGVLGGLVGWLLRLLARRPPRGPA